MEEIKDQHNIIINNILLIYKHDVYPARNFENLNFLGLKNRILKTKILERKIAQNDPHEKHSFAKNGRLSAISYTGLILKVLKEGTILTRQMQFA